MRKSVTIILIAAMTLTFLCSCGNNNKVGSSVPSANSSGQVVYDESGNIVSNGSNSITSLSSAKTSSSLFSSAGKTSSGKNSGSGSSSSSQSSSGSSSPSSSGSSSSSSSSNPPVNVVNTIGNTRSNLANGGFVAGQGEWVYYSNSMDNNYLYKMKNDGTGKQKLASFPCRSINVVGDWVYFINNTQNFNYIYKVRTDGTEVKQISYKASSLTLINDWIYDGLKKVKIDGSNYTVISNDYAKNVIYIDDWIHYANMDDAGYAYKIKIDGTGRTKTNGSLYYPFVIYEEGYFYFSGGTIIAKFDFSDPFFINQNAGEYFNIVDGRIYYRIDKENYLLAKMNNDGTGIQRFNNIHLSNTSHIGVVENWIYYYNAEDMGLWRIKTDGTDNKRVT